MSNPPDPFRVVKNPEPSCIFYDVVTANGNRTNFRPFHLDEAEHVCSHLMIAYREGVAQGLAAAGTGEGEKMREALWLIANTNGSTEWCNNVARSALKHGEGGK